MNRAVSHWTGLAVVCFLLLAGAVAVWQSDWFDEHHGPFLTIRRGQIFWVLSPEATGAEIEQLRRTLQTHGIRFYVRNARYSKDRRMQQATVVVWSQQKHQVVEFEAGTPYGSQPIMPIGFRYRNGTGEIGLVTSRFPRRLRDTVAEYERVFVAKNNQVVRRAVSNANLIYGLYEVYFLNDIIETDHLGLHSMMIRLSPDYHLDLHPEYRGAVVIDDDHEITGDDLRRIPVLDLKKITVYKGLAAVTRLGDERARNGLVILSRRKNNAIRENYILTHLYEPLPPAPLSE